MNGKNMLKGFLVGVICVISAVIFKLIIIWGYYEWRKNLYKNTNFETGL